jgi:hypothetical protein
MAICLLLIVDRSPDDLNVEKICLRVEHLALYLENNQLWSGLTRIIYKGKDEVSEIKYDQKKPDKARKATLISEPRTKLLDSMTARTFSTIKDIPGLGLLLKD